MDCLNLENIFFTYRIYKFGEYLFKPGGIYFLDITLFWLRYEKTLARRLELNPICTCYNSYSMLVLQMLCLVAKTCKEYIFYIYNRLIGPRSHYKFHKGYQCHHNKRYEKTRDAKSNLEKIPSKRMKNPECPFKLGVKILKVRITYSIWYEIVKSVAFFVDI